MILASCMKLSADQVRELCERAAAGERDVELAAAYGITRAYVGDIRRGRHRADAGGRITRLPPGATKLYRDNLALRAEVDRLRAEVERLRAG